MAMARNTNLVAMSIYMDLKPSDWMEEPNERLQQKNKGPRSSSG